MICPSHKSMCVYTVTIQEKIIFHFLSHHIRCISDFGLFCMDIVYICDNTRGLSTSEILSRSIWYMWHLYMWIRFSSSYTYMCLSGKILLCVFTCVHCVCTRTRSQKRNKMGKIDFIYGRMCTTNTQSTVGVVMHFMKSVDIVFRIGT